VRFFQIENARFYILFDAFLARVSTSGSSRSGQCQGIQLERYKTYEIKDVGYDINPYDLIREARIYNEELFRDVDQIESIVPVQQESYDPSHFPLVRRLDDNEYDTLNRGSILDGYESEYRQ
jgi:hypothetical protein